MLSEAWKRASSELNDEIEFINTNQSTELSSEVKMKLNQLLENL
jgi:hypothetical protein